MKDDERKFLDELQNQTRENDGRLPSPHLIAKDLGIHHKRAVYICEKWYSRQWLECGVSVTSGWLTDLGMEA